MILAVLLGLSFIQLSHAQKALPLPSSEGPFLIYNCQDKHWNCVLEGEYQECQDKRQEEMKSNVVNFSCASIGLFPTIRSCTQRQLFLVTQNHGDRFCVNDSWKDKF